MRREPISKLQRLQLASARQKLKLDTAKASQVEADLVPDKDIKRNQFGRPIVAYEEMPELESADMELLSIEFHRLACPHWAVAKYRPGFGPKNDVRTLSRDSWYFYETGRDILHAVAEAVRSGRMPDLLEDISTDDFDARDAMSGLLAFLLLEEDAIIEAAILHRTTLAKMEGKDKVDLADIRKSLEKRYAAMSKRRAEMGP